MREVSLTLNFSFQESELQFAIGATWNTHNMYGQITRVHVRGRFLLRNFDASRLVAEPRFSGAVDTQQNTVFSQHPQTGGPCYRFPPPPIQVARVPLQQSQKKIFGSQAIATFPSALITKPKKHGGEEGRQGSHHPASTNRQLSVFSGDYVSLPNELVDFETNTVVEKYKWEYPETVTSPVPVFTKQPHFVISCRPKFS